MKRIEFWKTCYLHKNFKHFDILPSPFIIWDSQYKETLSEELKGHYMLSIGIDWMGFGIGIDFNFKSGN